MTGMPFLPALLGAGSRVAMEAAFGADLSDADGSSWTWTDVTADVQHAARVTVTQGRSDNVSQAGAAECGFSLNNPLGNYTPLNPVGAYYPNITQNLPWRHRISLDGGATWKTRFQGYMDACNPVTDTSATVKAVKVTALGMLARIAGRKKPVKSALYRASSPAASAYWAMEEGTAATSFASGVGGAPLATITGPVGFGNATPPRGAVAASDLSGVALLQAPVKMAAGSGWSVGFAFNAASLGVGSVRSMLALTTDSGLTVGLQVADASPVRGNISLLATVVNTDGSVNYGLVATTANVMDGQWHYLQFTLANSGATVAGTFYIDGVQWGPASNATKLVQAGRVTGIHVGYLPQFTQSISDGAFSICHLAIWPDATARSIDPALDGYAGELAHTRLARLAAEENIALDLSGTSDVAMGPQGIDTVTGLLRDCEAADHGLLYDGFGPGIGYQCRSARYSIAAALTLDMGPGKREVAPPFEPMFDRQGVKNLYETSRQGGSSATFEQVTGRLGTDSIGIEDASATINLADDTPLPLHAAWLTALGTVDGFRYPSLTLNMRAIPAKAAALLTAGAPGFRINIVNPASKAVDLPPDPIDVIAEGWTETTSASTWDIGFNASQFEPWRVAIVDDATTGRVSADDATLAGTLTSTFAGSRTVNVGTLWTTDPADFPLDVLITGERLTLSAISGAASPQTFVISARSVNGVAKSHAAGEPVDVAVPARVGL